MTHLDDPTLRAFMDGELGKNAMDAARGHLSGCPECSRRQQELKQRALRIESRLAPSNDADRSAGLSPEAAYRRFTDRIEGGEMSKPLISGIAQSRRLRPIAAGLTVLVLILALFAIPQVRAAAVSFLDLFRVQQIAVVEVNPQNFPEQLGSSNVFEDLLAQNIQRAQIGDIEEFTDRQEAVAQVDFPVRLPPYEPKGNEYRIQPGASLNFEIDLQLVEQLLDEIGLQDLALPSEVDGAEVDLTVEPALLTAYGNCRLDEMFEEGGDPLEVRFTNCLVLVQTPSPSITAPEELNLPEIGAAFLQLMGLSSEEALEFSRTVDWTTTLVIPIPRYGSSYQTVAVDGVEGTLIRQEFQDHAPNFILIWVKDGVIYSVTGDGTGQEGIQLANSLK